MSTAWSYALLHGGSLHGKEDYLIAYDMAWLVGWMFEVLFNGT